MGVMPSRRGLAATASQAARIRQAAARLQGRQDGPPWPHPGNLTQEQQRARSGPLRKRGE
jgi:hypothetical protein